MMNEQAGSARYQRWTLLVMGLLAGLPTAATAQQAPSQYRSVSDVRPRIPDEHDRPYFRETQSHRGWEIREPQFTVFAATSPEDARWAAGQVAAAWREASRLADRWTEAHHDPDFGLSALQVAINNERPGDRYLPATTITVVGIQTQVTINVGLEEPSLRTQVVRLREAAAFAMLHTVRLDSVAPPWVVKGLAAALGRSGLTKEELDSAVNPAANFGGEQWRFGRSDAATLAYAPIDQDEAASRIGFLLHGDDARHAPAFFEALRRVTTQGVQQAALGKAFEAFPGDAPPLPANTEFDQLIGNLAAQCAAWKHKPLAGQPIFEAAPGAPDDIVAAEREMVVLLKLQRRMAEASSTKATADFTTTVVDRGVARTKVITYNRAKGATTTQPVKRIATPPSFASFAANLIDRARPIWATLDVDGSLLVSTDSERVQNLLAIHSQRYAFEAKGPHAVLVRRLENGQTLHGWLEENPQDAMRPVARFEIVVPGARRKASIDSRADWQAGSLPH